MKIPFTITLVSLILSLGMISTEVFADTNIPNWVKQVAEFWITDQIDDDGFVQVIEYLVQQEIITIPYAEPPDDQSSTLIPDWIKINSEFWVQGGISDDEFAIGLEWLINNGVIRVSMESDTNESPVFEDGSGLSGEVTIGLILPLTGDLATHGIENHEGSKFGVEEFNKHLQEIGASWNLKMVSEDSATNPVIALEKLTSLNAKGIGIVVGPETSSNIRNIKGYSDSNNMLLVSCCSSAPALAIPNDSVFRLVPDDRNQGTALAKLIQHEGIEVLIPVWRGDTWGDGLSAATAGSFVDRGGQVDEGVRYNPESPEFSASTSLLASNVQEYVNEYGAEKVAVLFLGFAEILQFMQSASEHDVLNDVRWFGPGANTKEHKLIDDPIGLEFSTNVQFTTVQFAASKTPTHEKVQEHLTESLGTVPNTFVHSSYDAVWIIGLAMLETQSSDVSVIKAKIPEIAENYSGAIGPTKLNEAGDLAQADYEVWGIRGAEWVHLGKYTQSDDSISLN
ncbi:MAG: ABC transporter substrate-binding protein [Nitrosopumilus sp.]